MIPMILKSPQILNRRQQQNWSKRNNRKIIKLIIEQLERVGGN